MRRTPVIALLVGAALLSSPARADVAVIEDGEEWNGPFNIAAAGHGHGRVRRDGTSRLQHRITTYRRWRPRDLATKGSLEIDFPSVDRRLVIDYDHGLKAKLFDTRRDRLVGRPKVWRPDRRTAVVSLPRRWLGRGVERYRWYATGTWFPHCDDLVVQRAGAASSCVLPMDQAPDWGRVTHRL